MTLREELQMFTGLGSSDFSRLLQSAPRRYKVYNIPKRNGGQRTIAQPARELKLLQHYMIENILTKLPVHDAAAAYQQGRSIALNAQRHAKSTVILKLDFQNFFPSVRVSDWRRYCRRLERATALGLEISTQDDLDVSSRILFWGAGFSTPQCLSIGAPSSPMLSNVLMHDFDIAISASAKESGASYTRYADDITISATSTDPLLAVEVAIRRFIEKTRSPALTLNEAKRGVYTSGQRRMVTGLVITPNHQVSLGRSRKRAISSMIHKYTLKMLDAQSTAKLQGLLAFAHDAEPSFVASMTRKYGEDAIRGIRAYRLPRGPYVIGQRPSS